jgi:hypothetical protein
MMKNCYCNSVQNPIPVHPLKDSVTAPIKALAAMGGAKDKISGFPVLPNSKTK